ncbi:hypothetical protein BDV3_000275 [Batrachochytrium dendrobatidis]|uniref:Uncharacterized protein n=1 Tax=Batrachochytrium dendrobatidis (strain JEL423) TaxID=403673 RepID=A0A177W8B7_BATDL|nr:hypothetical protein BDEG_20133 [Batrachochytrium dendrobatidis JEL423]
MPALSQLPLDTTETEAVIPIPVTIPSSILIASTGISHNSALSNPATSASTPSATIISSINLRDQQHTEDEVSTAQPPSMARQTWCHQEAQARPNPHQANNDTDGPVVSCSNSGGHDNNIALCDPNCSPVGSRSTDQPFYYSAQSMKPSCSTDEARPGFPHPLQHIESKRQPLTEQIHTPHSHNNALGRNRLCSDSSQASLFFTPVESAQTKVAKLTEESRWSLGRTMASTATDALVAPITHASRSQAFIRDSLFTSTPSGHSCPIPSTKAQGKTTEASKDGEEKLYQGYVHEIRLGAGSRMDQTPTIDQVTPLIMSHGTFDSNSNQQLKGTHMCQGKNTQFQYGCNYNLDPNHSKTCSPLDSHAFSQHPSQSPSLQYSAYSRSESTISTSLQSLEKHRAPTMSSLPTTHSTIYPSDLHQYHQKGHESGHIPESETDQKLKPESIQYNEQKQYQKPQQPISRPLSLESRHQQSYPSSTSPFNIPFQSSPLSTRPARRLSASPLLYPTQPTLHTSVAPSLPTAAHLMQGLGSTTSSSRRGGKGIVRPWTIDEDQALVDAIRKHGTQWTMVASIIPNRNRRQCKEHWARVLSKQVPQSMVACLPNTTSAISQAATEYTSSSGSTCVSMLLNDTTRTVLGQNAITSRKHNLDDFSGYPTSHGSHARTASSMDSSGTPSSHYTFAHSNLHFLKQDSAATLSNLTEQDMPQSGQNTNAPNSWIQLHKNSFSSNSLQSKTLKSPAFSSTQKDGYALMSPNQNNRMLRHNLVVSDTGVSTDDGMDIDMAGDDYFGTLDPGNETEETLGQTDASTHFLKLGVSQLTSRVGLWSHDEDSKLLKAYELFGPRWVVISKHIAGRNHRQCEKRFRRIRKAAADVADIPNGTQTSSVEIDHASMYSTIPKYKSPPFDQNSDVIQQDNHVALQSRRNSQESESSCLVSARTANSSIRLPSLRTIIPANILDASPHLDTSSSTGEPPSQYIRYISSNSYQLNPDPVGPSAPQFDISHTLMHEKQ